MTIKAKAKEIFDTVFYSFFSLVAQVYKIMSITALFLKLNYINEFLKLDKIKEFFDTVVSFVKQYKSILLYTLLTFGAISTIRKIISHKKYTFSLLRSILKLFELTVIASLLVVANLTGVPAIALLIAYFALDLVTYPLRYAHSLHKKQLVEKYEKKDDMEKTAFLIELVNKGHSAYALHKLFSDRHLIINAINSASKLNLERKKSLIKQLPSEDVENARAVYIQKKEASLFKKIRKFVTSAIIFALEVAVLFTTGNPAIACFTAALVVSIAGKIWDFIESNPFTSAWKAIEKLFKLARDSWSSKKPEITQTNSPTESSDLVAKASQSQENDALPPQPHTSDYSNEKELGYCIPDGWYKKWISYFYPR